MRLLIELAFGRCGCRTCRVDRLAWRWHMAQAVPGAYILSFAPLPPVCRHPTPVRFCRECGCWELEACLDRDGAPCHWVEPDLCSACARAVERAVSRRLRAAAASAGFDA